MVQIKQFCVHIPKRYILSASTNCPNIEREGDSDMSRIIPNKKQSDATFNVENCKKSEGDGSFNRDVELSIDSYQPNVLFRSEHYLVIDKPHSVRMNGEFEGTVQ